MGEKSAIQWTDSSWNPLTGCTQISPGCANCYAKGLAEGMMQRIKNPRYRNGFDLTLHPDLLSLPLKWKKPHMIFVNSMSDLFHKDVPTDYIKRVFDVMNRADWHTFQILTKRHERLAEIANSGVVTWTTNIWQGVSIENDRFAIRADYLREIPARVRFLSCEPLLTDIPSLNLWGIDWVIAGAESGKKARPMNLDWVRHLRDKCQDSGAAFFLKQYAVNGKKVGTPELDGRRWVEMPALAESEGV
jgi:protein gp37